MQYIPFEQITSNLFYNLIERGYKNFVLQKFEWPKVIHGKGFLLSAYDNVDLAKDHAFELNV